MREVKNGLLLAVGLIFCVVSALTISEKGILNISTQDISYAIVSIEMPPEATITGGDVTVCQNENPPPQITFTGDLGVQPYTFTYRINGGLLQTVITEDANDSVSINADISAVGTFTYTLVSVADGNGDSQNINATTQIVVIPSPDGSLGGTGSGTFFNGLPVFRQCIDMNSVFTFTNLSTTPGLNVNYNISWGDGSPDFNQANWTTTTHSYDVGIFNLVYTIEGSNGCTSVTNYTVFVGSNPGVSLGNPGSTNICDVSPLTFPITGTENNPPGTIYTVTFNDGSDPFILTHPPPATITHTFVESSCGTVSSDGTNLYENSFSAIIVASNPCSTSSVGVVPIYVSIAPEASFTSQAIACTNTAVCFNNTSIGDENNGSGNSCDASPNVIWDVVPATGFTVTNGDLGNDFGSDTPSVWLAGTDNICLNFTNPGTYAVTLKTGNRCGLDEEVRIICVEEDLVPVFSTSVNEVCTSLEVTTTNTTDESQSCAPVTYLWEVNYSEAFCGTAPNWNFTNGTNATSANPSFQFETAGTYELTMTASNFCGDFTTSQVLEVRQPPTVTIDPVADTCGSASFTPTAMVDSCADPADTITYNWSFPGAVPATSNQLNPGIINYPAVGDYTISFSVTNNCGTTTVTELFSIVEPPVLTNTNVSQIICSGVASTAINLTADDPNATFSWVSNAPSGLTGYIPNGTANNIPAQTITNSTNEPITLIYEVIPEIPACEGLPVIFEIIVEPEPFITLQPVSSVVCQNGNVNDLAVDFQGAGAPNYQWYQNNANNTTTGTAIAGAINPTFSPLTNTVGTTYYYAIISFSTGGCNPIVSDIAVIEVAPTTQIDVQPLNTQSICIGGNPEALSIDVSGGAANPTYQWFSNTENSNVGGTLIPGEIAATYSPPLAAAVETLYYYVEVNYATNGCATLVSDVSEINVVADPIVIMQPLSFQSLCQNTDADDLEVTVSGGLGELTYQWFVNTVDNNNSGSEITDATTSLFSPPTTTIGILYYYAVITQNVSGCEVTSNTSQVEITASAQFNAQPILDELCLGETTNPLFVSYTNGTGNPSYQWYQNSDDDTLTGTPITGANNATYNPDVNTVGSTYYYVIITFDSGGCSEIISETAEIIVNETASISDAQRLICSGNSFEYLPDTTNGDVVPLNTVYTWSNPTILPTGSVTGTTVQSTPVTSISEALENITSNPAIVTYTITPVTGNCVGENFEVEVTVNPTISIDANVIQNLCFEANTASIEIDIFGGVPFITGDDYTILWTGPNGFTSADEDIFNLEAGTYVLDIQDNGGCPYVETFTITEPPSFIFSNVDFDPETISCFNENDGTIAIEVSGGVPPYMYSWTLDGLPFSTDQNLSNLAPGNYNISVTDSNNCGPINLDFNIEEPQELQVTLQEQINVLCFGDATGSITVDVTGGRTDYIFAWIGPDGFTSTSQNITSLFQGVYNLTVTDRLGCTDMIQVEIIQNTQIEVDLTVTQNSCDGDNNASITIDNISGGVAPYDIAWSNLGTGNSQTDLSGGLYTITITDDLGCERQFTTEIIDPPAFFIDPEVTQMSCAGENDASISLNFQGGVDPVNLVWTDDPSAGMERNNLSSGEYEVTITDGSTCVIQESFIIIDLVPLSVSANVTNALNCEDTNSGSINLLIEGGTPPFDVIWSNGETSEDLTGLLPNIYAVIITDARGCEVEGYWEVTRFEPLELNVQDQSNIDCEDGIVGRTFIASASGGVPPFQYNWSSGTVTGEHNEMMTTNQAGLVILEVVDSLGCTANYTFNVDTITFGEPDFETTSFGFLNYGVYAIQDPIEFINLATGNYQSILWDFGDGRFSAEENPFHTYVVPGDYLVTQSVTYDFGCVLSKELFLRVEKGYKIVVPDAFTPNEDGINDFFAPVSLGLNTLEINIYDTWGSLIYKESGDTIRGWDGRVKTEEAENGNYYYTFSAKTFYGEDITKQGAFVFIK
ncbi:MAG: PKD domain-containing protein [Winogradskyella sp.]|uniref:PKD domain-containing protein n=1 Tax=Winogradskyella sp. TaxID=1883156 RepID=UPI0038580D90